MVIEKESVCDQCYLFFYFLFHWSHRFVFLSYSSFHFLSSTYVSVFSLSFVRHIWLKNLGNGQRFSFPCLGFLLPSVHLTCSKGHVIEMNVRRRNLITARKGKHVTRILSLFSSSRVTCLAVRGTEERFHSRSCISLSGFNKEEKKVPDSE